jgi:uracil-DNA glycosylase family 4
MYTGDRSGDWLFRAMHKAGFCNQPFAVDANDGLQLIDAYIAAACRCAPPQNKPSREEFLRCRPYLVREMKALKRVKVLLGLGKIGFDAAFRTARDLGFVLEEKMQPMPKFGHGVCYQLNTKLWLLGTFHPSQQNTFTGKLTEEMFDAVFARARELIEDEG